MSLDRAQALIIGLNSTYKFLINALIFFFAVYFIKLGFSGLQIGLIFAMPIIIGLVFRIPAGLLNDRLHCKNLILIALLLSVGEFAGLAFFKSFPAILAAFVIGGVGYTFFKISIDSLYLKALPEEKPSEKIGDYLAFEYLGAAGMMVAGFGLDWISFEKVSLIIGAVLLALIIPALFLPKAPTADFNLLHYKKDFFKKDIIIFALFIFFFALHFGAEQTSYGPFLSKNLGLSPTGMGLYMGISVFLMFFTAKIVSKKLERGLSSNAILAMGLLFSGIGHIAMAAPVLEYSFLARVLHETGDAFMFFFLLYGMYKLFPRERVGGHIGVMQFITILASFTGAMISGPVGEKFGYAWPIIGTGIFTLVAGIFALILFLNARKNEHSAHGA